MYYFLLFGSKASEIVAQPDSPDGSPVRAASDAALVTIQDLLGHTRIKTTQRYCRVSNLKVQREYHQAMALVLQRTG